MICLISKKVKTANITLALQKVALENEIKQSKLFFNINSVDTYIKTVLNPEFIQYNSDIHSYYSTPNKMIDEHVELKQVYSITIEDTNKSPINLIYELNFSLDASSVDIVISPKSNIPYKIYQPKNLYTLMLNELNNIKALNRIIINIFDTQMREKLKAFIHYIYKGNFTKAVKLPIFNGIKPESGVDGGLHLLFLNKKKEDTELIEVDEDEKLAVYEKPTSGKNGFNAYGKTISSDLVAHKKDLECFVDPVSISIEEQDGKKIYKSKLKGFVELNKEKFHVDTKIRIQQISRLQKQLAKDEDNNIEILIAQSDTNLDSVGDGVELISETVHIKGHIGAKSTIKALNLTIDGATHQDSKQEAKFASINRHKGHLRCHSAKINLLEGGTIYATNAEINDSLGGSIYAEHVTINRVKSNLRVFASSSITIKNLLGENNIFKINYRDIPTLMSKIGFLQRDLDDLRYKMEGAKKHSQELIPAINSQINELKEGMRKITQSSLEAFIEIKEFISGINTIIFVLEKNEELIYKTSQKKYESFRIIIENDYAKLYPTTKTIKLK